MTENFKLTRKQQFLPNISKLMKDFIRNKGKNQTNSQNQLSNNRILKVTRKKKNLILSQYQSYQMKYNQTIMMRDNCQFSIYFIIFCKAKPSSWVELDNQSSLIYLATEDSTLCGRRPDHNDFLYFKALKLSIDTFSLYSSI